MSSDKNKYLLSIKSRLWIMTGLLVIALGLLGSIARNGMDSVSSTNQKIYKHPFAVSNAVREIQYRTAAMDRSIKDSVLSQTYAAIDHIEDTIDRHEIATLKAFDLIEERYLGDLKEVQKARQSFTSWQPIRLEILGLMRQQKRVSAARATLSKGNNHVEKIVSDISSLLDYANNKAASFLKEAEKNHQETVASFINYLLATIIIMVTFSVFLIRSINRPLDRLKITLDGFVQGDYSNKVIDKSRNDEIGLIAKSLYQLKVANQSLTRNAIQIANGDLKTTIKVRSEKDELSLALQNMLKNLRHAYFNREGINNLNTVMRGDQDIYELSNNIIQFLCGYVDSPVAGLYIIDEKQILRTGGFALPESAKLLEGFDINEGLLGEAVKQQKIVDFDDARQGHIKISSASGEIPLRSISIMPVLFNDKVIALAEFGFLKKMNQQKKLFLSSLNDSLSTTLNAAITRDHHETK